MLGSDFAAWLASPGGVVAAVAAAFVAGSMAGSFLNVVAHRVPVGLTVVHGRSHCPSCGGMIRARDNVPVLGWLLLRGRCRDCDAAISPRYPMVEAACGCLAATLAVAELVAAGGDVPVAIAAGWAGRTILAFTIVSWAMLVERGHAVSATTVVTTAAVAALAAAIVPPLQPLAVWCGCGAGAAATWPDRLTSSFVGAVAGWAAGAGGGRAARSACTAIGAACGWQASLLAAVAAAGSRLAARHPAVACLAAAATIVAWHPMARAWREGCVRFAGG